MKKDQIISNLTTGVIIGVFINLLITLIVGVKEKEIYNYIMLGICSFIPSFVSSIFLISKSSVKIRKNISVLMILLISIISGVIAFLMGFLLSFVFIDNILNINLCEVSKPITVLYESIIGVTLGTISAYNTLIVFEKINKK